MQRRRRKKASPKNVFGTTSQSTQSSKKATPKSTPSSKNRRQIAPPPSVPGSRTRETTNQSEKPFKKKTNTIEKKLVQAVSGIVPEQIKSEDLDEINHEETQSKEEIVSEATEIVQNQILGKTSRKDMGLTKGQKTKEEKLKSSIQKDASGTSLKARQIIQDSMLKASKALKEQKSVNKKKLESPKPNSPVPAKKPQKKFRNRNSSYQPANREKRLDRSRHMEYKYEMRTLLSEIKVDEEFRSNLLATIWARGERQTIIEAKEFIKEKLSEGILDKEQLISLEKVVDRYTIRR